ncbi:MAG: DUF1214 domain-containing protein [Myxococcales bacterium]|nr:DUF1214 domain-containing protein [Myxococcales bacterium]
MFGIERSDEEILERLASGKAWEEFCDTLKMAGQIVLRPGSPKTPLDLAEGYRYLTRMLRAGLETFIENSDPHAPELRRVVHETAKMGADNPDNYYQNAPISGRERYVIRGKRGTVHYLGFYTQIGHYGQGGGMPPTGFIEAKDLVLEDDGESFVIHVACERPDGAKNWLPMKPETGTLIVRQTFLDRENEKLAELELEIVGREKRPSPFTPRRLDEGLGQASRLVGGAGMIFANWAEGFMKHKNELPEFDRNMSNAFGGDPNITYYHSYWELGPDEALVVEATPPPCDSWNFQINNHWMESLDYRYAKIHVNAHTARYEPDGSVRIVVAHEDPGHPNWLDTCAHERGTMCFRWIRAEHTPQPKTRVMKIDEVRSLR